LSAGLRPHLVPEPFFMDDAHRAILKRILEDPSLTVPLKIREFIRLYNENTGTGSPLVWNFSKEEWQRFEFLGDRILNLVAAEFLYLHDSSCREGIMTQKMGVVSNESLAAIAEHRGIDISIIVPAAIGQQQAYGDAVKGGALEACAGAMYLCAGFEAARVFVRELLTGEIECYDPLTNYIGRLQERYQQQGLPVPVYEEILPRQGPAHQPRFTFRVYDSTHTCLGEGTGASATEARQQAAKQALEHPAST